MKRAWLLVFLAVPAAAVPPGWKFGQEVVVSTAGLQRWAVPGPVLEAAREGLEDLRLWDEGGREVPYRVVFSSSGQSIELPLKDFSSRLEKGRTWAEGVLPSPETIDQVRVEVAAGTFLKSAVVEVSEDGAAWTVVARQRPLFRQPGQGEHLRVEFPPARAGRVRVTLDDDLSPSVPVQGLKVRTGPGRDEANEAMPLSLQDKGQEGRATRIELRLPARFVQVREIRLEVGDPFFTRRVTLQSFGRLGEDSPMSFSPVTIFRREGRGGKREESLVIPVRSRMPDRRARLLIENQDSPPLEVKGAILVYQPPRLLFYADRPGRWTLGVGHASVPAPRYETAALPSSNESQEGAAKAAAGAFGPNPSYNLEESFALWPGAGGPLRPEEWRRRAPVRVDEAGFQVMAVPPEVWREGGAFMLGKDGRQVPFELEPAGEEVLPVEAKPLSARKAAGESRWEIRLPFSRLAARRLEVKAAEKLFRRSVRVEEDEGLENSWGKVKGSAAWTATPGDAREFYAVPLGTPFASDRCELVVQDGNNAPLTLSDFRLVLDKAVLIFKAAPGDDLWLYYGHDKLTQTPSYDLSLMREELRRMDKKTAVAEMGEAAGSGWSPARLAAPAQRIAFGAALVLVAALILGIIVKLFPKEK